MIKILTGGGFGDAAMSIGKLYSKEAPYNLDLSEIYLTHVEVPKDLLPSISSFYKTQNINHITKQIPSWGWRSNHRKEFDYYLGSHWMKDNVGDESTWEINPFPPLKYDYINNIKTLVAIGGGRPNSPILRGFTEEQIIELDTCYKDIIFVGKSNDEFYKNYKFKNINMINKTTIEQLVNYICSCKNFIGYLGFSLLLAGLANKKIFGVKTNIGSHGNDGWDYRIHPKWDVTEIKNIKNIKI